MGLRTTSRTASLASKEDNFDSEYPSTSSSLTSFNQLLVSLHSDAGISIKMAPALTEPLSPTNKLSTSAASASPRPTAAGSPLQNNNNNHARNNNNESIESLDELSRVQTNLNHHNPSGNKDKNTGATIVFGAATGVGSPSIPIVASKGAFQLAFEQSVCVRKSTTTPVINGDKESANFSQMGPMCDSKSSQPPPSAVNSVPLIKSKISQIDAETAAKIITSQFGDFPSDIEEAITAEICLRQKLKSAEEEQQLQQQESVEEEVKGEQSLLEKLPMEEPTENIQMCDEKQDKQIDRVGEQSGNEEEKSADKDSESKTKASIISVQELPPIKTDSTVTASEDDNNEERFNQLDTTDCPMVVSQESGIPATPPRTPSAQTTSQLTPTSQAHIPTTSLTPQSTTSTMGGSSGNQKDFKDNTSEMDHDIDEDLLQVFKGLEASTGGDICDLAGFLSDYAMNYEDVNPPVARDNPLKEVQIEIEKNQQLVKRKIDFLTRRLRKMQSRYMSKQASEEISGLFEWSARTTKRKNSDSDHQQLTFAEERYHAISTTTMWNILNKIKNVAANGQQVPPVKKQLLSSQKSDLSSGQVEVVVPTYDDKITEQIAHVSGLLQSEMREVQNAIDSDATASSSGGESADEMVTYNNQFQQPMPISKRAAWRYSRDRAAIASRWSWLMSQISDLEFKIRQHTELYQQLRQRKGRVVMLNASEAGNLQALGGSSVNGYRDALPGGTVKTSGYSTADDTDLEAAIDAAHEASQGACRTRGFQSSYYRKRKLFQTANVHTISKKAARSSTIKCGCQWPLHPCALCTGRSDPTAPRDLPDTMMKSQRVALLDPGFHPVLSFTEDISNSIYLEAISRDPEWQNRVGRNTVKSVMKGALAAQRAAERELQRGVYATSGRLTPSSSFTTSTPTVGTGGKRKYTKRNNQDIHGGGSLSTTPLVANKLGKGSKKKHRHRSPDYNHYPRKHNNSTSSNSQQHQTTSQPAPDQQNVEQSNHHPAHSSLIYQHSKNNKIRKLSSASAAAAVVIQNQSGTHHQTNNINLNQHHVNNQQQYQSYNNELNFLHCDLDGATSSTNGLIGQTAARSSTSSPTLYKYERPLERKSRTSYDIDNIVIPYSVAAATRVEILLYKEIPTPKWRIVDYEAEDTKDIFENSSHRERISERTEAESNSLSSYSEKFQKACGDDVSNLVGNPNNLPTSSSETYFNDELCEVDEDEEDEDISDAAMILRHERALTEERRKFQTFMKFPWSTRSRANRRIDSRAESSGTNTPDPASPAPNTPNVGGDQESIPSPIAPTTPLTPLDSISETGEITNIPSNPANTAATTSITSTLNSISKRQERRRTVSTKKDKDEQRRSSTPDLKELIPPYEPIVFPIPNDLFDSMLRMMPDEYPPPQEDCQNSIRTSSIESASTTSNGLGDATTTIPTKRFCDYKINNNKNAFLTLNDQKIIDHVTGEDNFEEFDGPINGDGGDIETNKVVLMGAPPPVRSMVQSMLTKEVEFSPFICRNNLLGCSDTESIDSDLGDDDPNDPEWKVEPE